MKVELLNNSKKKRVMALLNENYGIEKLPHLFIQTGKENYRIYSGSLSKEELNFLAKQINIEIIGAKLCKIEDNKLRLNFDITNLPEISSQIKDNIIELTDEQAKKYMKGENIEMQIKSDANYLIIKHKGNFLGSGKNNKTFIQNYVPKERRIK